MRIVLSAIVLCILGASSDAWAHAEEPNSQNVFSLDDGWVLRANFGIVRSQDPRAVICEEAFLGGDGWMLGVLGETEWLTFGETTVTRTEDGCQFDSVYDLPRRPSDATVHASSGSAAFIINGEEGFNGLYASNDRGLTFERIQSFESATQQTTGVRYLGAETILVSGYTREDGAALVWSVDVTTGVATALRAPEGVTFPYVLAAAGGHLILLGRRGDQMIFWGTPNEIDQTERVAPTWPTWAELSDDGQTAWISGMDGGRGVSRGVLEATTASWEDLAVDTTAGCVEPVGEDLFVCGLGRFDDFDVLKVTPSGDVEGVLDFRNFVGPRTDCPSESSVGTVCPLVWREIAPYFGVDPDAVPDMGTADGGATAAPDTGDTAAPPPRERVSGDGCCATTGGARPASVAYLLIGLLLWRRRRALTQKMRRC